MISYSALGQRVTAPGAPQTRPTTITNSGNRGDADELSSLRVLLSVTHSKHSEILVQRRSYSAPYRALPSHACAGPLVLFTSDAAETEHKFKQLQSHERVAALRHEAAVPLLRAMDNTGDARICF